MNQKEATYQAIVNVLGNLDEYRTEEDNGMIPKGSVIVSGEHRKQVNMILFEGFRAKTIQLDREFTDTELKQYVSGLTSNWLRKDKRLNGGEKYRAKSPGSRAGSGDPALKAMRTLLSTLTTDTDKMEVQGYIDARIAELNVAKQEVIDFSALPADLQAKFSK